LVPVHRFATRSSRPVHRRCLRSGSPRLAIGALRATVRCWFAADPETEPVEPTSAPMPAALARLDAVANSRPAQAAVSRAPAQRVFEIRDLRVRYDGAPAGEGVSPDSA